MPCPYVRGAGGRRGDRLDPAWRFVPGGDHGGGHHEHVAERGHPPLVHAVVVGAELHLALARRYLHRVRRAVVGARLLRGARPHVADHACGCTGRPLVRARSTDQETKHARQGLVLFGITFFRVGEGHDQVRLLDPEHDLAALVRRRGHRVELPFPCSPSPSQENATSVSRAGCGCRGHGWRAWHGNAWRRHSPSGIATNNSSPLASAARDLAWLKSKSRSSCDDRAEPAWSPLSLWPCPPPPPLLLRRPLSVAAPRSAVTCPAKQVTYGNS